MQIADRASPETNTNAQRIHCVASIALTLAKFCNKLLELPAQLLIDLRLPPVYSQVGTRSQKSSGQSRINLLKELEKWDFNDIWGV